uniref:DUF4396 domain-containing protein n=1 Tax=Arcella intermedia TaxID=1963864 RepID=A0A6B2LNA2_9EUKA
MGDFSAMFYIQTHHPSLGMTLSMSIAMAAGILTSLTLETLVLRLKERMSWDQSLRTAWTMSFISMLTMEAAENCTDWFLTGGQVDFSSAGFWVALVISLLAGFLAPLPYNYWKLKKFGKSCH